LIGDSVADAVRLEQGLTRWPCPGRQPPCEGAHL